MRKVAIVGAGIGAAHAVGYAANPDKFKIAAICDLTEERAGPLADTYGATYVANMADVLADPEIDIVDICLPPHLHFQACIEALDAGKIVVCEKPLVSSLAEADALKAKVAETGSPLFPVFQYRYGLGSAQLLALIEAGLAGTCYTGTLETHWDRDAAYYAVDWRGTWAGEQGGAILGHAIHIHDLLSCFLGPVERIYAETATRVNDIEVEDCAALSLRMANGAVITSSVTLGCAGNLSRLRLMFEGFTVESDHSPYAPATGAWSFVARSPTEQADIDAVLATVQDPKDGFAGMFSAMADALDGKGGREVTLDDGRSSLEFVTAVYASSRSGAAVSLPLTEEHALYSGWLP
ncbi:MAG: Gfo/Idh/MocA family oxidoreductase [Pseudomonadota bacterium]